MKNRYGIDIWSDDNFFIEDGVVKVNYKPYPSLIKIVKDVRKQGFKGPLLLRFPHITKKQVKTLFNTFNASIKEYDYKGKFNAYQRTYVLDKFKEDIFFIKYFMESII